MFTISASAALENSIPASRPLTREITAVISVSHKSTRLMAPLPMPRMLYRPNSFCLRRTRNALEYSRNSAVKMEMTSLPSCIMVTSTAAPGRPFRMPEWVRKQMI